jgi:prepilin signal peptidase PulO-like enzyme (type II secretory pathway)
VPYLFYLVLFLLGLAAGSFINVLSLRYNPHLSVFDLKVIGGRSRCLYCKKELSVRELVPVFSFLWQKGKCARCGHKLSFQYPLVELVSGAIFVLVPIYLNAFYNLNPITFANFGAPRFYYGAVLIWIFAFLIWLLVALIDLRHYLIPNELNAALGGLGVALFLVLSINAEFLPTFRDSFLRHYDLIFSPWRNIILRHLFGAAAAGLFFAALSFLSRGKAMGVGDVKLAFASGLILGWPDVGLATALAFILGGIVGGFLLLLKKKTLRDRLPFAPIFVIGVVLTFFFGFQIIKGYFALFNL